MKNYPFRPGISRKEAKALTKALDHALATLRLSKEEQTLVTRFLNKINDREWIETYLEGKADTIPKPVDENWERIMEQTRKASLGQTVGKPIDGDNRTDQ